PHRTTPLPLGVDRQVPGRRRDGLRRDARKNRGKQEDRGYEQRRDRSADPQGTRSQLRPSGQQRRNGEDPDAEPDPRPARVGRDETERERENRDEEAKPKRAIVRRERERQCERNQRDQVAAEPVRLPERA